MSKRPNPEEQSAPQEISPQLLLKQERERDRLLLGLAVAGTGILVASCYAKEAGSLMIDDYRATLLGVSLVGAGVLGTLTRRRNRNV